MAGISSPDNTERLDHGEGEPLLSDAGPRYQYPNNLLPRKDYESLDYDRCHNKPYDDILERRNRDHSAAKLEAIKWIVTFFVGLSTAMVALFIDYFVKLLLRWKYQTVDSSIQECTEKGCLVLSLLYLLLFDVSFVLIAAVLTLIEPVASGSGIPEIKCYLNGVKIPRVVRLFSLVAKVVGVLFSVAGGLFVGKEGPMIHSGAIIGAGVPQFQSIAFRKIDLKYSSFRTDRDKRDFVSGGAAAGVAAAFGAPIGGVLFTLEEGSSFWNQKLTWRTFFCSMAATFSLNFFLSGLKSNSWGYFYLPGLVNFGIFKCDEGKCHLWNAVNLLIFIVMGLIGGFLGAVFNYLNMVLTKYRMNHINRKHKVHRLLEALLVSMVTTTVAFIAAMTLGQCLKLPDKAILQRNTSDVRTYFCRDGYYNDMATLFFNPQEVGIKQLFHQEGKFSLSSLGIFFMCFFFLMCWTYGVCVPSGLFVPSLLCGAAYGRFVATVIVDIFGYKTVYSGSFALIGSAALLGGIVRMTISLTIILIESTNEISFGLPIMLVLMVAKWSGDLFNRGLYDIHINLKGVPFLEWESPSKVDRLRARDIMESRLVYVFQHSRISSLVRILKTTAHNAFPVVSFFASHCSIIQDLPVIRVDEEQGHSAGNGDHERSEGNEVRERRTNRKRNTIRFEGTILRSQLVVLLKHGICYPDGRSSAVQPSLRYEQMTEDYPRYPDIFHINDGTYRFNDLLDVSAYMNPSPYTVFPDTPVPQVFSLFRSMGLRHLPVVNHDGEVSGMITRHNLTHEYLDQRLQPSGERESG